MVADKILNSKDKKHLFRLMEEQWGADTSVLKDKVLIKKPSGKIFIVGKEAAELEHEMPIRTYSMGNYFGKEEKDEFRVTIEGSQIIGAHCRKNIISLDDEQIKAWVRGEEVAIPEEHQGFCLVKHGKDFYGCGNARRGRLINHIPKTRRINKILELDE